MVRQQQIDDRDRYYCGDGVQCDSCDLLVVRVVCCCRLIFFCRRSTLLLYVYYTYTYAPPTEPGLVTHTRREGVNSQTGVLQIYLFFFTSSTYQTCGAASFPSFFSIIARKGPPAVPSLVGNMQQQQQYYFIYKSFFFPPWQGALQTPCTNHHVV